MMRNKLYLIHDRNFLFKETFSQIKIFVLHLSFSKKIKSFVYYRPRHQCQQILKMKWKLKWGTRFKIAAPFHLLSYYWIYYFFWSINFQLMNFKSFASVLSTFILLLKTVEIVSLRNRGFHFPVEAFRWVVENFTWKKNVSST